MTKGETILEQAVRYLADRCDGAQELDGAGFNRMDSHFGKKLAQTEDWTPRQRRAAWRMIAKYKGQLSRGGIEYSEIPEPAKIDASTPSAPKLLTLSDNGAFRFSFPYDSALVDAVKSLPNRKFDSTSKSWFVAARADSAEQVIKFATENGFDFADKVVAKLEELAELIEKQEENIELSRAADAEINVQGLGGTLRPFQKAGVAYALAQKRTFIADEMGLGKTVQALATIHSANAFPALIVCPASLKFNWKREAEKWLPGRTVSVWNGKSGGEKTEIVVINYDVLKKWIEALKAMRFKAVIYDESHYLKSYKAQRTIAAKELAKGAEIRLALTGTPVLNRPQELLSQLQLLGRLDGLGGFWTFAKRYCAAYQDRFGWNLSGASHLDELNEKLRGVCYIRRNKVDVLTELPAKQRADVVVEIDNRREYDRAEKDLIGWLKERASENKEFLAEIKGLSPEEQKERKDARANDAAYKASQAEQLVKIEALKQVAVRGKLAAIVEWIKSFLEADQKLVLFASHIEAQKMLIEALSEFNPARIFGEDSGETRQANVDRFQNNDDCKLIVCSLAAGGVGITLTASSNVAFVELGWNPATHDQAEDRCHRIGQTDQVTAWYLLAANTIDERINALIADKRAVVDAATEGEAGKIKRSASILKQLIKGLIGEEGDTETLWDEL